MAGHLPSSSSGIPFETSNPVGGRHAGCQLCGWRPAAFASFERQVGMVLARRRHSMMGRFCRDCGVATFRSMTNRTLLLGWWGVWAFFANFGILLGNLKSRRQVASLAPPVPDSHAPSTPLLAPLDPGKPLPQRAGAVAIGVLIIVATMAGVVEQSNEAARAESGDVSRGGELDVFDLQVGDCFNSAAAGNTAEIAEVEAVPCGELHEYEVYRIDRLEEGAGVSFPGDDAIFERAALHCFDAFQGFVGSPYADSIIDVTVLSPTRDSWERGDREYVCVAFDLSGSVRGSLKGAGR